ncbi:M43 family zinc metalloprotease [Flavobacterium coralii]|uniref:M43 family zinc metalloprotease n=1 Tax=Flavobacterium coralii TaxID=2838017 RepID=UPI000C63AEC4|nr:hypothetical protein [Flavobacterium sp.]|tara:strand:+ start:10115 stop:12175 length:2061 start_codon:yes stop_codon:yes gene_type:complete
MKKITFSAAFLVAALAFSVGASAQEKAAKKAHVFGKTLSGELQKCGATEYEALLQKKNDKRATTQEFEQWLAPKVEAVRAQRLAGFMQKSTNNVVTIPVVVHVVHNGDALGTNENIADAQVLSQITVLNQDFRRMLNTPGYNTNPVGADMEIEFCLAQQDPNGIATTGITRHNLGNADGWDMESIETILKPQTQWDPEKYLNIWVVDHIYEFFGELAGYAQFPTASGLEGLDVPGLPSEAETDGVVIGHVYFGSSDIYPDGTYDEIVGRDKGRTTTHEVGHFFGLRHIWGDGDCSADDFCADTPVAANANSECPDGIDSCPESPGMDMIENYMDYTNDTCQNIFTQDQKDRMVAVLANSPRRVSLITSPGCTLGIVPELDGALQIQSLNSTCSSSFEPQLIIKNNGSTALTSAVINYSIDGVEEGTYTWEGNLTTNAQATIILPTVTVEAGTHDFTATIANVNGTADEVAENNTAEDNFLVAQSFDTTQIIVTVMTDDYGDETIWALLDSNEEPLVSNIDLDDPFGSEFYGDNQLYTHTIEVENNQCYIFAIIDLEGDGICCEYGEGYYTVTTANGQVIAEGGQFTDMEMTPFGVNTTMGTNNPAKGLNAIKLYPNPANSILNISIPDSSSLPEGYAIYNNLGQLVGKGKITSSTMGVDISGYANGMYFIKINKADATQTLQFVKQ